MDGTKELKMSCHFVELGKAANIFHGINTPVPISMSRAVASSHKSGDAQFSVSEKAFPAQP